MMLRADAVVRKYDADFRWCNELEPEEHMAEQAEQRIQI